jgi:RimJ/RimL family protein N-acetyltransferase
MTTADVRQVRLRPIEEGDLVQLHRWYQTPELSTHLVDDIPARGEAEAIGFMRVWLQPDPANHRFAVVRSSDGRLLGRTALLGVEDGRAELHLFLGDPQTRGQGCGRAAVEALLDFGFGELALREIHLQVLATNTAARRLYESVGFRETGAGPVPAVKAGGEVPIVLMAISAAERPHL